jgi:ATP-dependent DNA helicase RecG
MKKKTLIENLLLTGVSEELECHGTISESAIAMDICAFLNGKGGSLVLGVDGAHVLGIENVSGIGKKLEAFLNTSIIPSAPISVSAEKWDEKSVLVLHVWPGPNPPYVFESSIYIRSGANTDLASHSDISRLIHSRQFIERRWERQPVLGADWEDLDLALIELTIRKASEKLSSSELPDPESFLTNLGLYQNGHFTHAAVILFAKTPARWLPQSRVRIVEMPEGKTGSKYTGSELFEGSLLADWSQIQEIMKSKFPIESHFNDQEWERLDRRKYPLEALDEGVMNALIHRDFSNSSGSVLIAIYRDKLEITNYGTLPEGWDLSDLKRDHLSLPRNPDIAHVCFLFGLIEKLGRGTLLISEKCQKAGLKNPKWSVNGGSTTLTFFAKSEREPASTSLNDLNSRQHHILALLGEGEPKTVAELLQSLENTVSDRTLRTDLGMLIRGHFVTKLGSGRNTRYIRNRKSSI